MANDDVYKLNEDLFPYFGSLKDYFSFHSQVVAHDNTHLFEEILKATIIKSFEFCLLLAEQKLPHCFFMIPSLRGICEEYIVEKFLFDHFYSDSKQILELWQNYHRLKSSISQWDYFTISNPDQTVYYEDKFHADLSRIETSLSDIFRAKFPVVKNKPFPSIYFMAEKSNLLELYRFLYHATSTFVHFNPGNLFRMGWGEIPNFKFSTNHFVKFYNYFSMFYGARLFCQLIEWQMKNGFLPNIDKACILQITNILDNVKHKPEIITFDEMNISGLFRALYYRSPNQVMNGTK